MIDYANDAEKTVSFITHFHSDHVNGLGNNDEHIVFGRSCIGS